MACNVMSVSYLAGFMHSLLGGFQASFNKPAVIQRTEGCIVASLLPSVHGSLELLIKKKQRLRGERSGVDVRNGTEQIMGCGKAIGNGMKEKRERGRAERRKEMKSNPRGQQKDCD